VQFIERGLVASSFLVGKCVKFGEPAMNVSYMR